MNAELHNEEERRLLLSVAREAIGARFGGEPRALPASARLREKRGVFVTLTQRADGELRGCVGFVDARYSVIEGVGKAAEAAAFHDGRFPPLRADELPGLALHVSLLSPNQPIKAGDVVVGTHGVILKYAGCLGLLLPQVPVEQGWDREQFLDALCRKAGVWAGAWKEPGAELFAFTAEVFGEEERP